MALPRFIDLPIALVAASLLAACAAQTGSIQTPTTSPPSQASAASLPSSGPPDVNVNANAEHRRFLAFYGGAYRENGLQAYVERIVDRLSVPAGIGDFRVTILNTPRINAFAQPAETGGGYVYITRGLLALALNEAQIAGVLAHEIAHLVARHPSLFNQRIAAAQNAAAALETVAGPGAGQAALAAAETALQRYSQAQELEADRLGTRIMAAAGYDPRTVPAFLAQLRAEQDLEAELRGLPPAYAASMASSHPPTRAREREIAAMLPSLPTRNDWRLGRSSYLDAIDGMLYGDDPEEGFVRGRAFLHPILRLAFLVPEGYWIENDRTKVMAFGPRGAAIVFEGNRVPDTATTVEALTAVTGGRLAARPSGEINGMETATAEGRLDSSKGRSIAVRLVAYRAAPNLIYRFTMLTPVEVLPRLSGGLAETEASFRRLSRQEAESLKPLRLAVRRVRPGDSARRLAYDMATYRLPLQTFLVLNGFADGGEPKPGERVKLVVLGGG